MTNVEASDMAEKIQKDGSWTRFISFRTRFLSFLHIPDVNDMLECVLHMEGAFDQTKVKKKEMEKIVLASHTR